MRLLPINNQKLNEQAFVLLLTKAIALKKLMSKQSLQASGSLLQTVDTGSRTPWLMINPSISPNFFRLKSTVS